MDWKAYNKKGPTCWWQIQCTKTRFSSYKSNFVEAGSGLPFALIFLLANNMPAFYDILEGTLWLFGNNWGNHPPILFFLPICAWITQVLYKAILKMRKWEYFFNSWKRGEENFRPYINLKRIFMFSLGILWFKVITSWSTVHNFWKGRGTMPLSRKINRFDCPVQHSDWKPMWAYWQWYNPKVCELLL